MRSSHEITSSISESKTARDILKHCSAGSIVMLDLDNTIIRPAGVKDLGSDQWLASLIRYACTIISDKNQAIERCIALYNYIQPMIKVKPVEPEGIRLVKMLQDVGMPVMGITARDYSITDTTAKQLAEVGLTFKTHGNLGDDLIKLNIDGAPHGVYYKSGILFCDGMNKGKCLVEFFKIAKVKPDSVVMLDDSTKNLLHTQEEIQKLKVSFSGLHYIKMQERVSAFKMDAAQAKLSEMYSMFTPTAKQLVEQLKLEDKPCDKGIQLQK